MLTKAWLMSDGKDYCIATYEKMPAKSIIAEMRCVARNRGYPVMIEWGDPNCEPYICSHRTDEHLKLRRRIERVKMDIQKRQIALSVTVNKKKKRVLRKELKQMKSELRRIQRAEREHENFARRLDMEDVTC